MALAETPGASPARSSFADGLGFDLDDFQVHALDVIDDGANVVVAAPTGSGKTVVADYAVTLALAAGGKAFYTTPLKALSNQKYAELVRRHGSASVGLLTGDNAINGSAPVVVMTTEVLRNMIYAESPALRGLRHVVLDEVHYLQNAYRGPVWEEVIIHLPAEVGLVCLSATVSNADELADWIRTVRGPTDAVVETRRPVALHDLYLLGERDTERLLMLPTLVGGRPNPEAASIVERAAVRPSPKARVRQRLFTPRRPEVLEVLADAGMLPAITFIFSRAACDDAVTQCLREGGRLTKAAERQQIRRIAEAHVEGIDDGDLDILGYGSWLAGLEAGYAAHHAGLVPPFKEAVEECFSAGLVKAVFATETLALGINMPARSVVVEKLTKFTGERHEPLTPGEYTQLTGRAGRRGIDEVGYAVVLWSPFVGFDQVAGLAGSRTYALTSSFRPTYNMAANLVRRYPPDRAHQLLNLSFAQFRADSDVVRLETQLARAQRARDEAVAAGTCGRGDAGEYRSLLRSSDESSRQRPSDVANVLAALERVRPGDVLVVPGGKHGGRVAVLSTSRRRGGDVRLRAITPDRRLLTLGPRDFPGSPAPVGRIELPAPFAPTTAGFQRQVASALVATTLRPPPASPDGPRRQRRGQEAMARAAAAAHHPVAGCPDSRLHLRALDRAERLGRDADRLERDVRGRSESLARQFDRVLGVLERWGYVDGWDLTPAGERLARLYHEADLLVAECLETGVFDGLGVAETAALASAFTFEARGGAESAAWWPTARLRQRWSMVEHLSIELHRAEDAAGLPLTRRPDPGFAVVAHRWASGEDLTQVIGGQGMSGGDFVRNVRQLVDLLRQLGDLAPEPATAASARRAADAVLRGVVAASSVVRSGPLQTVGSATVVPGSP